MLTCLIWWVLATTEYNASGNKVSHVMYCTIAATVAVVLIPIPIPDWARKSSYSLKPITIWACFAVPTRILVAFQACMHSFIFISFVAICTRVLDLWYTPLFELFRRFLGTLAAAEAAGQLYKQFWEVSSRCDRLRYGKPAGTRPKWVPNFGLTELLLTQTHLDLPLLVLTQTHFILLCYIRYSFILIPILIRHCRYPMVSAQRLLVIWVYPHTLLALLANPERRYHAVYY
jgi:hypothetical protein